MYTSFNTLLDEVAVTDPWETAEKAHNLLEQLAPWQHVRVGVVDGKVAAIATDYTDYSWEEAFRGRSKVGGKVS